MGSFARSACCAVLLLPLAACNQGKGNVNLDTLVVDSGRLGGMIDRSTDGLDLRLSKPQDAKDPDAAKRLAIDRQLRDAALKALILRNRLLYEDIIGEQEARETHWPGWVMTPPESALSPVDLQERYEWLSAEVESLAAHGCKIGSEENKDANFCAVQ
jgi:hypothetical protein